MTRLNRKRPGGGTEAKPFGQGQTGAVGQRESLRLGCSSQSSYRDAVVFSHRLYHDHLADQFGPLHLCGGDLGVLASFGELRKYLGPIGNADRSTGPHCLPNHRRAFLVVQMGKQRRCIENRCASVSGPATSAPLGLVGLFFGAHLGSPVGDQLIREAYSGGQVGKHTAGPLDRRATSIGDRLLGFRRMSHRRSLSSVSSGVRTRTVICFSAGRGGARQFRPHGLRPAPPRGRHGRTAPFSTLVSADHQRRVQLDGVRGRPCGHARTPPS